eukprot:9503411-Pyramimonas_sp.AAC.1
MLASAAPPLWSTLRCARRALWQQTPARLWARWCRATRQAPRPFSWRQCACSRRCRAPPDL